MNSQEDFIEETHPFTIDGGSFLLPNDSIAQNNDALHKVLTVYLSEQQTLKQ